MEPTMVEMVKQAMELLELVQEDEPDKIRLYLDKLPHSKRICNEVRLGDSGELLFHAAARLGDVDVMKTVMPDQDRTVHVPVDGGKRYTALHIAAANGRLSACRWLLTASSNVSQLNVEPVNIDRLVDGDGNSPLHLAVLFRQKDVANLLVQTGGNLSLLNQYQMTPISYCQSSDMFEILMQSPESSSKDAAEGALDINLNIRKVDATNRTVLHYAAIYSNNMILLKNFIQLCRPQELKLHANDRPHLEGTFLNEAARVGNVAALRAAYDSLQEVGLLQTLLCGETVENECHSPAMDALFNGRTKFFDAIMLMASELQLSIKLNLNSIVERLKKDPLIKEPDDVNTQQIAEDNQANAANHQLNAAEGGELAIDIIAAPQAQVHAFEPPLSSVLKKSPASAEATVDLFADVVPTYLALYAKKKEVFYFMIESGVVTVNQWDDLFGRTCLHWAVLHNRPDIVRTLLNLHRKSESALSSPTEDGWNPTAVISPTIKDSDGKTAFHIAFDERNEEMIEIMREHSAFEAHEEKLFKDREVYVQGLNAILVGAALLVGVTFAGWLQLPSNEFDSMTMKIFYVSNTVTFALAMVAICVTVRALIPTPDKYVGAIRDQLRLEIVMAALLLAMSVFAAAIAFTSAGFASMNGVGVDNSIKNNDSGRVHSMFRIVTIVMGIMGLIPFIIFVVHLYQCTEPFCDDIVKRMNVPGFVRRKLLQGCCCNRGRRRSSRKYRHMSHDELGIYRRKPLVHKLRCEEEHASNHVLTKMKTRHKSILIFPTVH